MNHFLTNQWPKVDISSEIGAPLGKRSVGRQRKNRIKSALEGGGGTKKPKETEKEKKRIEGKCRCPKCGELGHRQSSYECPYNGIKKRKRKPRKNSTKGWFPPEALNTETHTSEAITQDRLATSVGEGTSSQSIMDASTPSKQPTQRRAVRKLSPKKKNAM